MSKATSADLNMNEMDNKMHGNTTTNNNDPEI